MSRDGKSLYVGIAKGLGLRPNVPGDAKAITANSRVPYDTVGETLPVIHRSCRFQVRARLRELTRMVIADRPHGEVSGLIREQTNEIRARAFAHLKHVVYSIRENRTYALLGDLGKGNGDPSRTLFGEDYTPSAMVASKDQAVCEIIGAVSHSRFWAETAIIIIEDDA